MSSQFGNSILIVLFNYASCAHNKEFFIELYEPFFKQIIFYSDLPLDGKYLEGVNYLSINRGFNGHKIFYHFGEKYSSLIEESDGLFYTMDDNIINLRILNQFDSNKIIFSHHQSFEKIDQKRGWWWDTIDNGRWGKFAVGELQKDERYAVHEITDYSGAFSDYFYLPKRYLTKETFELFEIFSKHDVFLEIAVPTIIYHIEKSQTAYQQPELTVLWGEDRDRLLRKELMYEEFSKTALCVHPIKLNTCPDSKDWLIKMFYERL